MIKTSIFLRSLDKAHAVTDPFNSRGDVAAKRVQQICPVAIGYTQTRADVTQLDPAVPPAYSGVMELWFSDPDDALHAQTRIDALASLWHDDSVEVAGVVSGHERIVMRLPEFHTGSYIKGVFPFRRKPGMSVADFQTHWWQRHGPIAALTQDALCYAQCHPFVASYAKNNAPDFDGITELYWRTTQDADAAMASRQMREDQSNDAGNFVDRDSVQLFLASEEVVLAT